MEKNIVLGLALFALAISAIGLGFNYYVEKGITGLTTYNDTGKVNLTVSTNLMIEFQSAYELIAWGNGYVNITGGSDFAILDTATNEVSNGTWVNTTAKGFVVENIGNVNCSLYIRMGKNNVTFIGGSRPSYKYNVSNNETGSCTNSTDFLLSAWNEVNTTADYGTKICDKFPFEDTRDQIKIDIQLVIPSDSRTGLLEDIITATAEIA